MSAWLIYSMMGIYPVSPAEPLYTITTPRFDKITIHLDARYYKNKEVVIERVGHKEGVIKGIKLDGKNYNNYFISHDQLVNGQNLKIIQHQIK
jgi:putative alpha-1,2-mannosidase